MERNKERQMEGLMDIVQSHFVLKWAKKKTEEGKYHEEKISTDLGIDFHQNAEPVTDKK